MTDTSNPWNVRVHSLQLPLSARNGRLEPIHGTIERMDEMQRGFLVHKRPFHNLVLVDLWCSRRNLVHCGGGGGSDVGNKGRVKNRE